MWTYKTKEIKSIDDFPKESIGFIYKITNLKTNKIYIGKKVAFFTKKIKISKKEKLELKTRKIFKVVKKESDWQTYYGSSIPLKEDIKLLKESNFKREILKFCYSKKELSYYEVKYQMLNEVLEKESYNGNILGRFFPKDINNE